MNNKRIPLWKWWEYASYTLPLLFLFPWGKMSAQAPLTVTCPGPITLDCSQDIYDPDITGDAVLGGDCDPADVFIYYDDIEIASGCSYILERTYYASGCGQEASCTQIITVVDDIPLTLNCPHDFTLATCSSPTMPQQTGGLPSYTDNCSEPTFTWSDEIVGNPVPCCDAYTIIRIWTATDQCGQPATCEQLIFVPGQNCDDGDPCTLDECVDGVCVHTPITCEDEDPCTIDFCDSGDCYHEPINCDDGDPCTVDYCDGTGQCIHDPINCDDGNPCTIDYCDGDGFCRHDPVNCDDGNPCTVDYCDADGVCQHDPVNCDDGDPCTVDYCDAAGVCHHDPMVCDDNNPCTTDFCENGACMHVPVNCDDGDPCTIDYCDESGICHHDPMVCDDGDPCTIDECVNGICVYTPIVCTPSDACMIAVCNGGVCEEFPVNCDDGDPCTIDECVNGNCTHTPVNCDDGDPTTLDECVNGTCTHTPIPCDDGDPCTVDEWIGGVCTHTPLDCDDGDPCTYDFCDEGTCYHEAIVCESSDPCMTSVCVDGICIEMPNICDDGDPCTIDECVNGVCVFTPINCDDGDPNTIDECVNGVCTHTSIPCTDNNPCTIDVLVNGVCTHTLINCDDGDPCTEDVCVNGVCQHNVIPGCGSEPPQAGCDYSVFAFIDYFNPDFNGPWLNNVYLVPASLFNQGSSSDSNHPLMEVKRSGSYINFDWTTNGACMDVNKNWAIQDPDKGKVYRTCLPVTPYDIFQWKPYKFRISDEYGSDECTGYYMVIPYFSWWYQGGAWNDFLTDGDMLQAMTHTPFENDGALTTDQEADGTPTEEAISFFPNPGENEFYISLTLQQREQVDIRVLDITGKVVLRKQANANPGKNTVKVETQDLLPGTYIIQFTSLNLYKSTFWIKAER